MDKEVTEQGYIDIGVTTKNGSEAILTIGSNVITVIDDLILLNGSLIGTNKVYLTVEGDNSAYLTKVELLKDSIRIHYDVTGTGGTLNAKIDWRVR